MAYNTNNPPLLVGDQPIAGPQSWVYVSSHDHTVVVSSTHITDGKDLGMKAGDSFRTHFTSASNDSSDTIEISEHRVTAVASTYITLSAGLITSSAS